MLRYILHSNPSFSLKKTQYRFCLVKDLTLIRVDDLKCSTYCYSQFHVNRITLSLIVFVEKNKAVISIIEEIEKSGGSSEQLYFQISLYAMLCQKLQLDNPIGTPLLLSAFLSTVSKQT